MGPGDPRNKPLIRGGSAAAVGRVFTALVNFALTALMLRHLGVVRYGQLAVALSALSFIPFADFGIGSAVVSQLAGAYAKGDEAAARGILAAARTPLRLASAMLVTFGIALAVVAQHTDIHKTNLSAVGALVIAAGLSVPLGIYQRVLVALQRNDLVSAMNICASALALVVTATALLAHAPLWVVAVCWYVQLGLAGLLCLLLAKRRYPSKITRGTPTVSSWSLARRGAAFVILTAVAALSYETDELLITSIKGPADVAIYDVHSRLFSFVLTGSIVIVAPIWPAVAAARANGDTSWITTTCRRTTLAVVLVTTVASGVCLAALPVVIHILSGGAIHTSIFLGSAFAVWVVVLALGSTLSMILSGLGVVRRQIVIAGLALVANAAIGIPATFWVGPVGPVLGTIACQCVSCALLYVTVSRQIASFRRSG